MFSLQGEVMLLFQGVAGCGWWGWWGWVRMDGKNAICASVHDATIIGLHRSTELDTGG